MVSEENTNICINYSVHLDERRTLQDLSRFQFRKWDSTNIAYRSHNPEALSKEHGLFRLRA